MSTLFKRFCNINRLQAQRLKAEPMKTTITPVQKGSAIATIFLSFAVLSTLASPSHALRTNGNNPVCEAIEREGGQCGGLAMTPWPVRGEKPDRCEQAKKQAKCVCGKNAVCIEEFIRSRCD